MSLDVRNKFGVGVVPNSQNRNESRIRIQNASVLYAPMTTDDALILAAWLVAMAGVSRDDFDTVLDAVEAL